MKKRFPGTQVTLLIVLTLVMIFNISQTQAAYQISGEQKKWHNVTLTFDGPSLTEGGSPNPFTDYRLNVTFTKGTRNIVVPGYFAADGDAANTGASSGTKWRVHFMPDEEGTWTFTASFRTGTDIAINDSPTAGSATSFDGETNSFSVAASDKTGADFRGKGLLKYVNQRYLQFAGNGEYYLKGGADSPENFLAYYEFDGTSTTKHHYDAHLNDWVTGDPTWAGGKGKRVIGALNYLASKGMNSVYFLTMNVNGDGNDVWPWTSSSERYRFDVSKLAQWEMVFAQMDKKGLMLHVVLQETENDQLLDSGALGNQRKLYYRELIARYGHHPALVWNLGEENTNTDAQRKSFATYLKQHDPYKHPVVVHTYPGDHDAVYDPLMGYADLDGPSLQNGDPAISHSETLKWINDSSAAGRKWFVCVDEIGPAGTGVKPDADDNAHDIPRKQVLWGNLMAGGAGCEWYFGYSFAHDDLDCEDWRSRNHMWELTKYALDFFKNNLPYNEMSCNDGLTTSASDYVLAKTGSVYAIYLPSGGTTDLNLSGVSGTFSVQWFDPRNGGSLQNGSVTSITGGASRNIGNPPSSTTSDWVVLVKLSGSGPTPTPTPTAPPGSGDGLTGKYYDNVDFTTLKVTRVDQTVDFNWGSGSPDASIAVDTFSVRWTGKVLAPYTATYTFYVNSNDGNRLWINGVQLTNRWTDGISEQSGTISLNAGQQYDLTLEMYEGINSAACTLSWSCGSISKQVIPRQYLYSGGATVPPTATPTPTPAVTSTPTPTRP